MNIKNNILETIGNTPLVKINKLTKGKIFAKLEKFNPAGSIKDRPALNMIDDAEKKGLINKDTVIIEPTSGNTGIGLALVCAVKDYKLILIMPETMSIERRQLLAAYGAEIVLTEGSKGMQGSVDKANELLKKYPNSFIPQQFSNPANPEIHYEITSKEIWKDTDGQVDIIIGGVGTGGTISGISQKLKELNPKIKAVAVEPKSSPLISKGIAGSHKIQGIGANFIPENYNKNVIDEIITVSDEDALTITKSLATKEGIFCGISSGAAMFVAIKYAEKYPDKNIVVILPDGGEKYLSTL